MDWIYTLSGLAVGFIVGMTGVGGGALMTPLLVLAFGIAPATAVGTDLLYAAVTKSGGGWIHGQRGTVEWKVAGLLAIGSLPAALLTLLLLKRLAVGAHQYSALITTSLGVALILTALVLAFKERLKRLTEGRRQILPGWRERYLAIATVIAGAVLGALVTISSVGAGALGAAALLFLYPRLPAAKIVGTDIVHAVPLTAVAGLGHASLGTVDFSLLGSLLAGSLPGIYLGTHLGTRIPERVLRPVLAAMLVLVGGKLVW